MAKASEARIFRALLRRDFPTFVRKVFSTLESGQAYVPNWHFEAIAYQLERVRCGEIKRLIINMPPRSLKSITASVAFPAFVLGHDPTRRIIWCPIRAIWQRNTPMTVARSWKPLGIESSFPARGLGKKTPKPKSSSRQGDFGWPLRSAAR
jgi:hypothetical protein